jgi:nucleotide-binding universal stress UspA family protein
MELRKILWPTDFSGNAEEALPYVTSLSEKYSCEVHVIYVIEELAYHDPWYGEFDRDHIEKIHTWEEQKAKERLDQICESYLKGCPLYMRHIAIGDPATEILKVIDQEGMDMVVMATHGRRGYFSYGSLAEKIMRNSPVPVVMIPIRQNR